MPLYLKQQKINIMRKTILDIPKYKELYTIIGNEIRQVRFIELRLLSNTKDYRNPIEICGKIEIAGMNGTMSLGEFYRTYRHLHFAATPNDLQQECLFDTCFNMNVIQTSSSLGCFDSVFKAIKKHFPTADNRYEICWSTCAVLLRAYYWDGLQPKVKLLDWKYDVLHDRLVTSMGNGYYLTEQECRENNRAIVHKFEEQKQYKVSIDYAFHVDVAVDAKDEVEAERKAQKMVNCGQFADEVNAAVEQSNVIECHAEEIK